MHLFVISLVGRKVFARYFVHSYTFVVSLCVLRSSFVRLPVSPVLSSRYFRALICCEGTGRTFDRLFIKIIIIIIIILAGMAVV